MQAGPRVPSPMTSADRIRYRTYLSTCLALLTSALSHAADPGVDAGSLLQQNERELNLKKTAPPAIQPRGVKPSTQAAPDEPTVVVSSFKFVGNTLLSEDALNNALSEFINRPLTLAQLKEAADAMVTVYRAAGWIVRAYLPRQEIQNGIVTIQIVEALFGGAQLQGPEPKRLEAGRLLKMAESNLVTGKPLNGDKIDRTLLLLDDLPGVSVTGNLVAGKQDGETNLALSVADEALVTGSASVDNYGSRATGAERVIVNLNINSPVKLGDALSVNALKSQGSDYQRVSYAIPLGDYGWRVGLHASNLSYRVVTDEFKALDPHGTATTAGWHMSYPILRSQVKNVYVGLSYDHKNFDNTSNSVTNSYSTRAYTASLNANQIDRWGGGGGTNAGISVTSGTNSNTDSRYAKLNLTLARLQSIGKELSLYGAISSQSTNKNLDSSERMYLGGSSGIRAFPSSEGGGSEGSIATLELRKNLKHNAMLSGFYDYGRIKINHDNSLNSPSNPNDYTLKGYGLSLAWQPSLGVEIKFTIARRSGDNPAALANGNDADGTRHITRAWLSAGIAF